MEQILESKREKKNRLARERYKKSGKCKNNIYTIPSSSSDEENGGQQRKTTTSKKRKLSSPKTPNVWLPAPCYQVLHFLTFFFSFIIIQIYFVILDQPIQWAEQNEDLVLEVNELEKEFVSFLSNDQQEIQESSKNFVNRLLL